MDALRPGWRWPQVLRNVTRSVTGGIPTQSVGTIIALV